MSRELQILALVPQAFLVWWGTWTLLAFPTMLEEIYSEYLGDKPLPVITQQILSANNLVENLKHSYDNLAVVVALTFLFVGIFIVSSRAPDKVIAGRSFLFQTLSLLFLGIALVICYVASIMPLIAFTMKMGIDTPIPPPTSRKIWDAAPWVIGIIFLTILVFRYREWRKNQGSK